MTDRFTVKILIVGEIRTNCYLMQNQETGAALIVDPGDEAEKIAQIIEKDGGTPEAILLTHGHHDHVMAVGDLRKRWPSCKVYIGSEEKGMLSQPLGMFPGTPSDYMGEPDEWVDDGEVLSLIGTSFSVLRTPGHTKGSVCYWNEEEGILFSGDTLFRGSCGRTDFPGGSMEEMRESLKRLKDTIPDEVYVLPGHMNTSVMENEKRFNPYMAPV
ncbi:MAG: MBL fold metallo-hydrolase [Lachnospiraceae bacterium]|nr:MBL fold metallo-hydrolase [Lachnospiraceae bacterium]